MIAALTYDAGSAERAQRLVHWIMALQSWPYHFLLCHEVKAPQIEVPIGTHITTYVDNVQHHPESKNLAFQAVAVYIASEMKESFLYMESDCVPTNTDWFPRIQTAYEACGKPYMGPIVEESKQYGTPRHMAAIAVYPWALIQLGGGEALIANEEPFPSAMARGRRCCAPCWRRIWCDHDGGGRGDQICRRATI